MLVRCWFRGAYKQGSKEHEEEVGKRRAAVRKVVGAERVKRQRRMERKRKRKREVERE